QDAACDGGARRAVRLPRRRDGRDDARDARGRRPRGIRRELPRDATADGLDTPRRRRAVLRVRSGDLPPAAGPWLTSSLRLGHGALVRARPPGPHVIQQGRAAPGRGRPPFPRSEREREGLVTIELLAAPNAS